MPAVSFGAAIRLGTPLSQAGIAGTDLLKQVHELRLSAGFKKTGYYLMKEASQLSSAVDQQMKLNTVIKWPVYESENLF